MPPAALRRVLRVLHLLTAAAIGTYLYSPLIDAAWAAAALQWGVFPLMAASGLAMWQQARLARALGGRRA